MCRLPVAVTPIELTDHASDAVIAAGPDGKGPVVVAWEGTTAMTRPSCAQIARPVACSMREADMNDLSEFAKRVTGPAVQCESRTPLGTRQAERYMAEVDARRRAVHGTSIALGSRQLFSPAWRS